MKPCPQCNAPNRAQAKFCAQCGAKFPAKAAARCLTCGRPIRGRYWEVDGIGPYCDPCRKNRPPCQLCGAPLSDEHWQLSDGRIFCQRCHQSGIFTPEAAAALYAEAQNQIIRLLDLRLNIPTGVALVDRNQLEEIIRRQSGGNPTLDAAHTLGIYARTGIKRGIYLQSGLPRTLFLQVAAHEYAHAWQGENCPLLRDPLIHEGFAEWVAYRIMAQNHLTDQMARMKQRDDIYGQGLQWALALEQRAGTAAVVQACREAIREVNK